MKRTALIAALAAALSVSVAAPVGSAAVEPKPRTGWGLEPSGFRMGSLEPNAVRYERPSGVRGNFGKRQPRTVRLARRWIRY
jgi:hypothetical protein